MNNNIQNSSGEDYIARELRAIKETIKRCCCTLACKEWKVDCNCNCNCDCQGGGGQCCCIANSVCDNDDDGVATATVPANSCVTKILASFVQERGEAKFALIEGTSGGTTFFCHRFVEDSNLGGEFDTNFVQPLCVGNEDATFTVTAFAPNGTIQDNALVTLTVVYCEDCCAPAD